MQTILTPAVALIPPRVASITSTILTGIPDPEQIGTKKFQHISTAILVGWGAFPRGDDRYEALVAGWSKLNLATSELDLTRRPPPPSSSSEVDVTACTRELIEADFLFCLARAEALSDENDTLQGKIASTLQAALLNRLLLLHSTAVPNYKKKSFWTATCLYLRVQILSTLASALALVPLPVPESLSLSTIPPHPLAQVCWSSAISSNLNVANHLVKAIEENDDMAMKNCLLIGLSRVIGLPHVRIMAPQLTNTTNQEFISIFNRIQSLSDSFILKSDALKDWALRVSANLLVMLKRDDFDTFEKFAARRVIRPLTMAEGKKIKRSLILAMCILANHPPPQWLTYLENEIFLRNKSKTLSSKPFSTPDYESEDALFSEIAVYLCSREPSQSTNKLLPALLSSPTSSVSDEDMLSRKLLIGLCTLRKLLDESQDANFASFAASCVPAILERLDRTATGYPPDNNNNTTTSSPNLDSSQHLSVWPTINTIDVVSTAFSAGGGVLRSCGVIGASCDSTVAQSIVTAASSSSSSDNLACEYKARLALQYHWYNPETEATTPALRARLVAFKEALSCLVSLTRCTSNFLEMASNLYPAPQFLDPNRHHPNTRLMTLRSLRAICSDPSIRLVHKHAVMDALVKYCIENCLLLSELTTLMDDLEASTGGKRCDMADGLMWAIRVVIDQGDTVTSNSSSGGTITTLFFDRTHIPQMQSLDDEHFYDSCKRVLSAQAIKVMTQALMHWSTTLSNPSNVFNSPISLQCLLHFVGSNHHNNDNTTSGTPPSLLLPETIRFNVMTRGLAIRLALSSGAPPLTLRNEELDSTWDSAVKSLLVKESFDRAMQYVDVVCSVANSPEGTATVLRRLFAWRKIADDAANALLIQQAALQFPSTKPKFFKRMSGASSSSFSITGMTAAPSVAPVTATTSTTATTATTATATAVAVDDGIVDAISIVTCRVLRRLADGSALLKSLQSREGASSDVLKLIRAGIGLFVTRSRTCSEMLVELVRAIRATCDTVKTWASYSPSFEPDPSSSYERADMAWGRAERRAIFHFLKRASGFSTNPPPLQVTSPFQRSSLDNVKTYASRAATSLILLGPISLGGNTNMTSGTENKPPAAVVPMAMGKSESEIPLWDDAGLWNWILITAAPPAPPPTRATPSASFDELPLVIGTNVLANIPAAATSTTTTSAIGTDDVLLSRAIVESHWHQGGLAAYTMQALHHMQSRHVDEFHKLFSAIVSASTRWNYVPNEVKPTLLVCCLMDLHDLPPARVETLTLISRCVTTSLYELSRFVGGDFVDVERMSWFVSRIAPHFELKVFAALMDQGRFMLACPWAKACNAIPAALNVAWSRADCPHDVFVAFDDTCSVMRFLFDKIEGGDMGIRDRASRMIVRVFRRIDCDTRLDTFEQVVYMLVDELCGDGDKKHSKRTAAEALSNRICDVLDHCEKSDGSLFGVLAAHASASQDVAGGLRNGLLLWIGEPIKHTTNKFMDVMMQANDEIVGQHRLMAWCGASLELMAGNDDDDDNAVLVEAACADYITLRRFGIPDGMAMHELILVLTALGKKPMLCTNALIAYFSAMSMELIMRSGVVVDHVRRLVIAIITILGEVWQSRMTTSDFSIRLVHLGTVIVDKQLLVMVSEEHHDECTSILWSALSCRLERAMLTTTPLIVRSNVPPDVQVLTCMDDERAVVIALARECFPTWSDDTSPLSLLLNSSRPTSLDIANWGQQAASLILEVAMKTRNWVWATLALQAGGPLVARQARMILSSPPSGFPLLQETVCAASGVPWKTDEQLQGGGLDKKNDTCNTIDMIKTMWIRALQIPSSTTAVDSPARAVVAVVPESSLSMDNGFVTTRRGVRNAVTARNRFNMSFLDMSTIGLSHVMPLDETTLMSHGMRNAPDEQSSSTSPQRVHVELVTAAATPPPPPSSSTTLNNRTRLPLVAEEKLGSVTQEEEELLTTLDSSSRRRAYESDLRILDPTTWVRRLVHGDRLGVPAMLSTSYDFERSRWWVDEDDLNMV